MLKIFAKHNSTEKIAVYCNTHQIKQLMERFKEDFGGNWVLVDEVFTSNEILKFNDGQMYKGYDASKPHNYRYSSAIKKFNLN